MFWFKKEEVEANRVENTVKQISDKIKDYQASIITNGFQDILENITGDGKKLLDVSKKLKVTAEKLEVKEIQLANVKVELADREAKKEIEIAKIEHLMGMKEERMALDIEKKEIELTKKFHEKEKELMKKMFDDNQSFMESKSKDLNGLYKQVLKRLPNVNYDISEERQLDIGKED